MGTILLDIESTDATCEKVLPEDNKAQYLQTKNKSAWF